MNVKVIAAASQLRAHELPCGSISSDQMPEDIRGAVDRIRLALLKGDSVQNSALLTGRVLDAAEWAVGLDDGENIVGFVGTVHSCMKDARQLLDFLDGTLPERPVDERLEVFREIESVVDNQRF